MRLPLLPGRILERRSAESRTLLRLIADNRGVTAIEYTLIAALIALVFVALIEQIGDFVSTPFDTIAGQL
jgi:pilus assembly protein Flp/PilA